MLGGAPKTIPDPMGLDGTRKGFRCMIDPGNKSNARLGTHRTTLTSPRTPSFRCPAAIDPNHNWTLAELQEAGLALGSVIGPAKTLTVTVLEAKAKALQGLLGL